MILSFSTRSGSPSPSAPESTFIKGQAGEGSENKVVSAEYRLPVPDFLVDARIERVFMLADLELGRGQSRQ